LISKNCAGLTSNMDGNKTVTTGLSVERHLSHRASGAEN
jgi:hypothetical protein